MKFNSDSQLLGAILGILAPLLVFCTYYLINYSYMNAREFINFLALARTSASLLSLCVLANLLVFYIFLQKEKYLTVRGVLLATFLYAIPICYLKFFTPSL